MSRSVRMGTVAVLLGLVVSVSPGRATVVRWLGFDAMALAADRVVVAEVVSVTPRWTVEGDRIESVIALEVTEELSGISAPAEVRIVQLGGAIGEWRYVLHGLPSFEAGERVMVFLRATGPDRDGVASFGVVGMAQGKFRVVDRPDGGADLVQDLPVGLALAESDAAGSVRAEAAPRPLVMGLEEARLRVRVLRGEVVR